MSTNERIIEVYNRHLEEAYEEELAKDEGPNGEPIREMAVERTLAELGCTATELEDAISEDNARDRAESRMTIQDFVTISKERN